jgi:glycosyltransferase involved in cell wall biosynthesis
VRICLVAPQPAAWGTVGYSVTALAELLSTRFDVTLIPSDVDGRASEELRSLSFACDQHRRSAAVMEAIRSAYGDRGPDYLEVCDSGPDGLVPLQARLTGDPLLAHTLVGVRVSPSAELACLHDRMLKRPGMERVAELEREQLRLADRLLWPGGDSLGLYRRYYGEGVLPEAERIRTPIEQSSGPFAVPAPRGRDRPLRMLFLGELRRREGALDLAEACLALPLDDWELTLAGTDSPTAWMHQPVGWTIEAMAGEDPRVRVESSPSAERRTQLLSECDLLVVPSRLGLCGDTALEAMRAGVPVLATPLGDLVEVVEDGVTGWLAGGVGTEPLERALDRLLTNRGELDRVRGSGAIARRFAALTDPEAILSGYERLLGKAPAATARATVVTEPEPLVTGVVPYYRASEFVSEAVASLLGQTHRNLDVLIVNDGSFVEADAVLDELAGDPRVRVLTRPNGGEPAARNLGALVARGEYLVMLDADNVLEPQFVERALAAMRREPALAYVSCWLRMIAPDGSDVPAGGGYAAIGNGALEDEIENWDGDTLCLMPRRLFADEGFRFGGAMHSDWQLYRLLRSRGRLGAVIPELLARYRVVPGSLMRAHGEELLQRGWAEARDRNLASGTRWTAKP